MAVREQHVVHRGRSTECPRWQTRIPTGDTFARPGGATLLAAAATLADARAAAMDQLRGHRVVEHLEHELDGDLFLRRALDQEVLRRDEVAGLLGDCLTDRRVRTWLAKTLTDPGETPVVVACVPGDPVSWIVGQYDTAPLVVAIAVSNSRAWWSLLAEPSAVPPDRVQADLSELGLLESDATVEDWMVKVPLGEVLTSVTTLTKGALRPAA